MEGEGGKKRKRNMQNEDEEDEDQNMDKFFALIRSTRDMRERILATQKEKSKDKEDGKGLAVRNPTFQPQDFMELDMSKGSSSSHLPPPPPPHPPPHQTSHEGPSSSKKQQDSQRSKDVIDLDLNLSL